MTPSTLSALRVVAFLPTLLRRQFIAWLLLRRVLIWTTPRTFHEAKDARERHRAAVTHYTAMLSDYRRQLWTERWLDE